MSRGLPTLPALVVGSVRHTRLRPVRHSFTHGHYQWLIDLDDPPRLAPALDRLTAVHPVDHLDGPATFQELKAAVLQLISREHIELPPHPRVLLLAHARLGGHVFDPLSVYWVLDASGETVAAVLEVRNTYGGRHTYVLTPDPGGAAQVDKVFLVSPFNDTTGRYAVRLRLDAERVTVAVRLDHGGSPLVFASATGRPVPLTNRSLVTVLMRYPLLPQRVSALIRVHGVWLWSRRLPVLRERAANPRPFSRLATPTGGGAVPPAEHAADLAPDPRLEPAAQHTRWTRGWIARALVRRLVRPLPVRVRLPDGRTWGRAAEPVPVLQINDADAFFRRLESHPKIGLGEAYMAGDWAAGPGTDLADLLIPFAARLERLLPRPVLACRGLVDRALPAHQRNTLAGSRTNVSAHYDLSNELFAAFLDETMSYSSALFDEARPWGDQDLAAAQWRKIDAALDAAGVGSGTRLLEIGSGWGELAIRAARRGATVTTITLSREQQELARERIAAAGVADRAEVELRDYRELTGQFDAIVSIEMIEAVGESYWPVYVRAIDRALAPGGTAVIQAILMEHHRFEATKHSYGWIQKHVFPGGLIPSLEALEHVTARHTSLRVGDVRRFGPHYAHTLRRWRRTFDANWPRIATAGFDEIFRRQWEFYLAYCEAGFATGYLDVAQLTLRRT